MSVYKIFAEKDATIYSDYGSMNTGMDAILELTKNTSLYYESQSTAARILIKFSDDDISDVISKYVGNKDFKAYLRLYMADASGLPTDYTIEAFPISGTWDMGVGRFGDSPINKSGVSWKYRNTGNTGAWETGSFNVNVTASFPSSNFGGGVWYKNFTATQSFGVYINKDVNIDVTSIVKAHVSGSIPNNGLILKTSGSLEFNPAYNYVLNYFSRDTNTVYPPVLELKWDDSTFNVPTSSAYTPVPNQDVTVTITNNKGEFSDHEIYRFRLNVREQFPSRTFSTSSLYTVPKYLPSSSYYAIKDTKSDINVVDFDESFTKISADSQGNYFDVYMYGLEPQRYYKLLIKTVISGSTIIYDNRYFFKVTE